MKKINLKLALIIALLPNLLGAQETVVTKNSDHTGESHNIVARNTIFLKPGFKYTAQGQDSLWAHIEIDETLPPITDVICADESLFPIDLDTDLPVGAIPGQAGVSPTGAANYTIPIEVPPAAQNMQPNLSVAYNSQAGNGIMGVGWNLAGLSAITRVPKNIYNDGVVEEIKLDFTDNFAFNGQRLVLIDGELGKSGSEYRTEVESYVKVTAQNSEGNGPLWFKVETKDGLTIHFGNSEDSRVFSGSSILAWKINRIEDQYSNYIEFKYRTDDDEQPIATIKYGGNTDAGENTYNTISFNYVERNDANTVWYAGKQINTNLLLENIEIVSDNAFVRNYEFSYICNLGSKLSTIQLTGSGGEVLNATQFDWTHDIWNVSERTHYSNPNKQHFVHGDYNGDGRMDFITYPEKSSYSSSDQWNLYLANESGNMIQSHSGFLDENFRSFLSADFDADGFCDFIMVKRITIPSPYKKVYRHTFFKSDGDGSFSQGNSWDTSKNYYDEEYVNRTIVDYNGDGKLEVLCYTNKYYIIGYPSMEKEPESAYQLFSYTGERVSHGDIPSFGTIGKFILPTTQISDFNGNGCSDLLCLYGSSYKIYKFENETGRLVRIARGTNLSNNNSIDLGDFNGDGKTDILKTSGPTNPQWSIMYYHSNKLSEIDIDGIPGYSLYGGNNRFAVSDFNADGISDIIVFGRGTDQTSNANHINLFFNIGNGKDYNHSEYTSSVDFNFDLYSTNPIETMEYHEGIAFFHAGDYNGDGRMDLFYKDTDGNSSLFSFVTGEPSNKLKKVIDGFKFETEFNYLPLTNSGVYNKHTNGVYPLVDFQYPTYVVAGMTTPNGIGGNNTLSYHYGGAKLHLQGKGFLGFLNINITDHTQGLITESNYRMETGILNKCIMAAQTPADASAMPDYIKTLYQPILTESIVKSGSDIIKKTTYTNSIEITDPCENLDYELFYVHPDKKVEIDYRTNQSITSNYDFDEYGNLSYYNIDYNGDVSTETRNTYIGFGSWWCPKTRIEHSKVTQTRGANNFIKNINFQYDNNGALTEKKTFTGLPKSVSETYEAFDNFGNPKTITISAAEQEPRKTTLEYDNLGRFIEKRTQHTDALDFTESFTYDGKTGNLRTHTDLNGLITTNHYDGFGKIEKTEHIDGTVTDISRHWAIEGEQLFFTLEQTSGEPDRMTYYDFLGRTLKSGEADKDGTMVYADTEYTPKGELDRISEPYTNGSSPTLYTQYEYYNSGINTGRLKKITQPTTATQTYTYPGGTETKITTNNNTFKTTITDGTGAVTSVNDNGGLIEYTYYAHGGTKDITYNSSSINMTYDDYGRQQTLNDPNTGQVEYTYNAFGELENQTDNRNNFYEMHYDALGRLKQKDLDGNKVVSYTYDNAPGKGIGALAEIKSYDNNISYTYEYNDIGLLNKKTENIQGETFVMQYDYDANSRLNKIVFPSGYTIDKVYENDYLSTVQGTYQNNNTENIFTNPVYNHRGQIINYSLGNDLNTTRGYDQFGLPTSIATPGIQTLAFEIDPLTGNMNWRKQTDDNGVETREDFTYDNNLKNRLESWKVGNTIADSTLYTDNGNIDKKTGIGHYTYGTRPHAVTEVENTGNVIREIPDTITYTAFNKVESIEQGDYRLEFTYGPDNQRKKTELYEKKGSRWALSETKHFIAGGYEVIGDDPSSNKAVKLHYVYGADGLAAIFELNKRNPNLYYIHKDHLGSYSAITNNKGKLHQEMSFDPWGRRRDAEDWSYASLTKLPEFDRGFTGHEHLDEFNLINMNGRVYDPILGRFLSPDNYVQAPDYTQSLNRYSYCLNNPLIYTDPSGNSFLGLLFRAIAGNYIRGVGDNWINKGMPIKDAFKATPIVAGTNFSPGNFTQQYNYGFSNPQVDAHNLVQNELKFEQRYDRWEATQRGRGRRNPNGIFGTNYELGPVGIGVGFEIGLPEWLPWATHNTGFSVSLGFVADAKDNLHFYITEGTPTKNNVSFSAAPEAFYVRGTHGRKIYNDDLEGYANQFEIGLGPVGGSVSSPDNIRYRQWTVTGLGSGIDVSTGSWRTYTRLYKIYGR